MKKILFLSFILFTISCVTDTDVLQDKLTVEGHINQDEFARVYLTNSLPFKGVIDSLEVAKSIESKAKVELFDGETSEILTLKKDDSYFPFLYYRSNEIKGQLGKKYKLKITIRDYEFNAETNLPEQPVVLNIEFLDAVAEGRLIPGFKDLRLTINNNKPNEPKYFKLLIKNETDTMFEHADPFIFNTENILTDTFPIIMHHKIYKNNERDDILKIGVVTDLQVVAITKAQYDFWLSVKGDVTVPIDNASFTTAVKGNISNGAFGYWSGESKATFRFKVPE
ncbi:hypothetical protein FUA26_11935 [Seonamhaeicola algicola]|uniref:DUF4249 domain-containing protein n=1 Tax=Seonamhaeicola algicola TaxID=1719036 RepID=A0A5C7AQB0_9FLAO|nr:DUF4249 family protein [Seonamhaeicola algicola]TXE10174.1 hypothetical protein FUA26_11935 [Seonamhaeicola algicola]